MTLDELELNSYKLEFSRNFVGFRTFGGQKTAKQMKIA